ncbi:MAG: hypothetical protein JO108_21725 [Acidobacteriaceae bacterium]|nr:hypothetical protein [Acidobacteriaceae bacterium]
MKRTLNRIMLATTLSALFGSVSLMAQNRETAEIPFDYHVSTKVLPAGKYMVEQLSTPTLFRISDNRGHSLFVSAPCPKAGKLGTDNPRLAFVHSGSDYVLSEIWMPGGVDGATLRQSDIERQLTRKIGVASVVNVALGTH